MLVSKFSKIWPTLQYVEDMSTTFQTKQQITDLHSLNKAIIRKQYPLPIITEMLDQISDYFFYQT